MKIGVITENFQSRYESGEIFAKLKQIGFDGVDYTLSLTYKKPDKIFSEPRQTWIKHFRSVAEAMRENGIEAFQTHATFPTDYDSDGIPAAQRRLSQAGLEQFSREIEATALLGAPYIVIHPINIAVYSTDKQADFEANMDFFSKIKPVLQKFNVKLGVENMFTWDSIRNRHCPTGCSTPEDMIKYIDSANSDSFVGCLDTGHMLINCFSPAEAVRKLGKRLKLLHVHDNYGVTDNHNAPGQGRTDWHDFAAALKETNYDGAFCMETSFGGVMNIAPELAWDYARYAYAAAKKITSLTE